VRFVLDTNVLVSAFVFPGGPPEAIYRRVFPGELTLIVSRPQQTGSIELTPTPSRGARTHYERVCCVRTVSRRPDHPDPVPSLPTATHAAPSTASASPTSDCPLTPRLDIPSSARSIRAPVRARLGVLRVTRMAAPFCETVPSNAGWSWSVDRGAADVRVAESGEATGLAGPGPSALSERTVRSVH
jgi:hypothetical protein